MADDFKVEIVTPSLGIEGNWEAQTDLSPADWLIEPVRDAYESWKEIPGVSTVGVVATRLFPSYVACLHETIGYGTESEGWSEYLPDRVCAALTGPLLRHTATPETCWIACWDGHGDLGPDWRRLPRVNFEIRDDFLLKGPFSNLTEWEPGKRIWPTPERAPDYWWPEDHAWLVTSDTDLDATYINCSEACAQEILALEIEGIIEAEASTPTIGH